MVFAEQLQTIGRGLDQLEYDEVRLTQVAERAGERLQAAIAEEYLLFREECLKAVQRGEWRCSMRIERDRYETPKRVGELLSDKSLSGDGKWACANLKAAMRDHFTAVEAELVRAGLEERLRRDGFCTATVTAKEDPEYECEEYRFCIDISAAWWRIL